MKGITMQMSQKGRRGVALLGSFCSLSILILSFAFLTTGMTPLLNAHPMAERAQESVESLIQVGKYRLNFKVIRGGSLTILLEAGGGMRALSVSR